MFSIIEAKRAGLLSSKHWLNNILAGVIVGVVALPLAMAFAIASGAKPEQGIYTAIVAGVMLLLMGLTRLGGVIIFVGQWKDFFGLSPEAGGEHFHKKLWHLIVAFPGIQFETTALALFRW